VKKRDKVKHKIRINDDSHARDLANELKFYLIQEYGSQGMVKPRSPLCKLVNTSDSDLMDLTMSDVCIVRGGSNDVSRNESSGNTCIKADC
jgi:hypothetical protein